MNTEPKNKKVRSDAIQQAARGLLEARGIDVIQQQVELRPLAKDLAALVDCHYSTAKRHLARAVRLMRGEDTRRRWGGMRPGGGRPREGE